MRLSILARIVVVAITALLLLAAVASLALAATSAVAISDFRFTPAQVTVNVGDTVRWTNNAPTPHTATSNTGQWDSGTLAAGQSFSFTFTAAGSYAYRCTLHPSMTGSVMVQAAAAPGASAPAASAPAAGQMPNTSTSSNADPTLFALGALVVALLASIAWLRARTSAP